jgi:hypothetical protein
MMMMSGFLAVSTVAVGLLAANPQPQAWQASYGKALKATKAANSPLLVVLDKPNNEDARIAPELLQLQDDGGQTTQLLQPYTLCHVDVTTDYGKKVASAFRATRFPHVAIIDKTGSTVIYHTSGKIDASQWTQVLSRHKNGQRTSVQAATHMSYKPVQPVIYSDPISIGGSYCPSCQRQSF